MYYPEPIARLIESFSKLPGIGQKQRLDWLFIRLTWKIKMSMNLQKSSFSKTGFEFLLDLWNLTESDPCAICTDPTRDRTTILVVEESKDVLAMEKIREYRGLYHVLHGTISPMNGISPDEINVKTLITRLMDSEVKEVIIATNATSDGEATAMYLARMIKPAGIKVTRLARGLAVGSDIEYADEITLSKAVENRLEI